TDGFAPLQQVRMKAGSVLLGSPPGTYDEGILTISAVTDKRITFTSSLPDASVGKFDNVSLTRLNEFAISGTTITRYDNRSFLNDGYMPLQRVHLDDTLG